MAPSQMPNWLGLFMLKISNAWGLPRHLTAISLRATHTPVDSVQTSAITAQCSGQLDGICASSNDQLEVITNKEQEARTRIYLGQCPILSAGGLQPTQSVRARREKTSGLRLVSPFSVGQTWQACGISQDEGGTGDGGPGPRPRPRRSPVQTRSSSEGKLNNLNGSRPGFQGYVALTMPWPTDDCQMSLFLKKRF